MAFQWEKYLAVAKDLSAKKNNEEHMRSAISRSYYAAFNVAREVIVRKDTAYLTPSKAPAKPSFTPPGVTAPPPPRGSNPHLVVIDWYRNNRTDKVGQAIGDRLRDFKVVREVADYDSIPGVGVRKYTSLPIDMTSKNARNMIRESIAIIRLIRKLPP